MEFDGYSIQLKIARLELELNELEWERGTEMEISVIRNEINNLKYKLSIGETHDYDF